MNTKQCTIWAADNNGQIANGDNDIRKTTESWAIVDATEKEIENA